MPRSRIAVLECTLRWQCRHARHVGRVYFEKLDFWRDFFAGTLASADPLCAAWSLRA
jgi:hypothetical protein